VHANQTVEQVSAARRDLQAEPQITDDIQCRPTAVARPGL
jgi:hypothetical protein